MSPSPQRTAQLESQILHGIRLHKAAAIIEGKTYRTYQREMRDRSSPAFAQATEAYCQANLLADSYRRALAKLTDELGYVPKPGGQRSHNLTAARQTVA